MPLKTEHRRRHPANLRLVPAVAAATITRFSAAGGTVDWGDHFRYSGRGQPGYLLFYGAMIVLSFFYTAIVFNPKKRATI